MRLGAYLLTTVGDGIPQILPSVSAGTLGVSDTAADAWS